MTSFKLSAPHVSFREYMYEGNVITMPLVLLIACFVKLFRIPLPGSTDIPPVASLQAIRVPAEKVDAKILKAITDLDLQLHDLGFSRVDLIGLTDFQNNTRYGGAVYRSADGDTVAWIRYRLWPNLERRNRFARLALYSLGPQGEIILTTAASRDLLDPPDWNVEYHPRISADRLRDQHLVHARRVLGSARPMTAGDPEAAFDLLEHTHQEFVDFQLERGVFVRPEPSAVPAGDLARAAALPAAADLIEDRPDDADPLLPAPVADATQPIIDAVRRLETKQSPWLTKLLILGISVAAFIFLGAWQWQLKFALILVAILFVHELGHYAAMKAFGYKNIHMFFIPLLGAAVSGRNYRVSGWKKAIVSLAGPLPSIAMGLALAGVGLWIDSEWCIKGALITLILNVLNLAPFLPLDGGQVAHVTLFSRSNLIDLLFRIGTIAALMLVAFLLQAKFLFGLGIAMIIGLPTVWRTMKVTQAVRTLNLPEPSNDAMPAEAITAVVNEIQRAKLPIQGTPTLAKMTLSVYETVIVRPPSWPATLGIWALYLGGLFAGVIGIVVISLASFNQGLLDFMPGLESKYERIDIQDGQFRLGQPPVDPKIAKTDLLVWRLADSTAAADAFKQLSETTDDSVARLGNVVVTSRLQHRNEPAGPVESVEAQMAAVEQQSVSDPRLDDVQRSTWRRAFGQNHPALIVVATPDQAQAIIQATESLPDNIGAAVPIGPWTPKANLTGPQQALRSRLRVLQGRAETPPWETQPGANPEDDLTALSVDEFRDRMRESAKRIEQTQQQRLRWIQDQADSSEGKARELYKAYLNFETDDATWREDPRAFDQKGTPPRLANYLKPLLADLGYLHDSHPLVATGVSVEAFELDPETETDSFQETFPLAMDDSVLVYLNLYPTSDAAAAYACVHAWLKNLGIDTVVWTYDTIKQ